MRLFPALATQNRQIPREPERGCDKPAADKGPHKAPLRLIASAPMCARFTARSPPEASRPRTI